MSRRREFYQFKNIENEYWIAIKGFERLYEVSNMGRIRSWFRGQKKYLCPIIVGTGFVKVGYHTVHLCKEKRSDIRHVLVHRIVAENFIPNPENKPCINHINGIKTDNRVENLEWCTYSENMTHAFDMGLNFSGEKALKSKLKNIQVIDIFKSKERYYKLAEKYNVHYNTIVFIKNKTRWQRITQLL